MVADRMEVSEAGPTERAVVIFQLDHASVSTILKHLEFAIDSGVGFPFNAISSWQQYLRTNFCNVPSASVILRLEGKVSREEKIIPHEIAKFP
ncbi:hypothetical protein VNO77_19415 [Canavalia gladiata]|uniref:Uncharacterized protein n=1 Tax=Canavalia gladiata TaxID=3824 RepID=A0AAN9LQW7_CANGL